MTTETKSGATDVEMTARLRRVATVFLMLQVSNATTETRSGATDVEMIVQPRFAETESWMPRSLAMMVIKPGQHGSTFGGNPVAAKVAVAALEVVREEELAAKARKLGELFRSEMERIINNTDLVVKVRGRGLLNAIIVNDTPDSKTAWNLCVALKENGLLAKPTHGNIIRFAPPLVMTEDQLLECASIIEKTIIEFKK